MGLEMAIPGLIGGLVNYASQEQTNTAMSNAADKQIAFQTQMSDTAHQREVADLQKAGLNPILSAGGGGSSTPTGAMPNLQAPQIQMPDMMAYGISMKQLEQTDAKLAIDRANSASSIAKNLTDNQLTKANTILSQKGMIRANLEGEGAQMLQNIIKSLKDSVLKPNPKNLQTPNPGAFEKIMDSQKATYPEQPLMQP